MDIKGLTDRNYAKQASNVQPSTSKFNIRQHNAEQYQSTHTIHVPSPAKIDDDHNQSDRYHQPMNAFHQQHTNSEFQATDEMNRCVSINGYYADDYNYGSDNCKYHPLDHKYDAQSNPWSVTFNNEKNSNGILNEGNLIEMDGEFNVPNVGPSNLDHSLNDVADIKPVKPNVYKSKRVKLEFGKSNISIYFHISII